MNCYANDDSGTLDNSEKYVDLVALVNGMKFPIFKRVVAADSSLSDEVNGALCAQKYAFLLSIAVSRTVLTSVYLGWRAAVRKKPSNKIYTEATFGMLNSASAATIGRFVSGPSLSPNVSFGCAGEAKNMTRSVLGSFNKPHIVAVLIDVFCPLYRDTNIFIFLSP